MFSPWWYTLLFTVISFPPRNQADCPKGVKIRKEWRTLQPYTRFKSVEAIGLFMFQRHSEFKKFSQIHQDFGERGIHGSGHFLPWHRHFVIEFEKSVLRYGGYDEYVQHYWDATPQAQEALKDSPIFQGSLGFGELSSNCVRFYVLDSIRDTSNSCVRRSSIRRTFDGSSVVHENINKATDYHLLSHMLEGGYHSQVHVAVGGSMGSYDSPIDPIFFFHHAQIDRYWALWQSKDFENRLQQFNRTTPRFERLEKLDSELLSYPGVTVRSVMDISALCYCYDDVLLKPGSPVPPLPPVPASFTPTPLPANCLVLPGFPEGVALNTSTLNSFYIKHLRGCGLVNAVAYLEELKDQLVKIPLLPQRPSWCLIIPGLPHGKCIDTRNMDQDIIHWWIMSSLDYVEKYLWILKDKLIDIPTSGLKKRSTTPPAQRKNDSVQSAPSTELPTPQHREIRKVKKGNVFVIELGEICLLEDTTPLPDDWIRLNKLNVTQVREMEFQNQKLVQKLNNFPGLIPESALVNYPDSIKKRLEEVGVGPDFTISALAKGIAVEVNYEESAGVTAEKLCDLAKKAVYKIARKPTPDELAKLIGVPLFSPNAVSNPFHQCA